MLLWLPRLLTITDYVMLLYYVASLDKLLTRPYPSLNIDLKPESDVDVKSEGQSHDITTTADDEEGKGV